MDIPVSRGGFCWRHDRFHAFPETRFDGSAAVPALGIDGNQRIRPRVINVDGHPAYARVIAELKQSGDLGQRCRCRPSPYLNNIIEQDHRFIKKRIAASRYVRNPIYVAVVSTILGQALIFGNVSLLLYGGLVWLFFHLFVLVYEEPTLRASFGSEYEVFCKEVPRWIPRLTPWDGHLNRRADTHR